MLSINTNLSSMIVQNSMGQATSKLNQAIERMSTGFKINHASDNAANYSISTNMTTKMSAYMVAEDNVSMGLDMLTTASENLSQIESKLSRLRALATQASNGTYGTQSKDAINSEANALVDEIERLYSTSEYNGIKLFENEENINIPKIGKDGFVKEITKQNTSNLTKLSEVASNVELTDGTYSISSANELAKLAKMTNDGYISEGDKFILANDIDLAKWCIDHSDEGGWTPIGNNTHMFLGSFDGNGYKISNLRIDRSGARFQGLFGRIDGNSVIKNLAVVDGNIVVDDLCAGLIIGGASASTTTLVENCYSTGKVTGAGYLGGLAGQGGNAINCYSTCDINSSNKITGGLYGLLIVSGVVDSCFAIGDISSSSSQTGGLIGQTNSDGTIKNSYATGNVCGTLSSGGLIGLSTTNTIIEGCYSLGNITSTDINYAQSGGLIGTFKGKLIVNSYAKGNVNSKSVHSGGLIGAVISTNALIDSCYSTGIVNGNGCIGGFIGTINGNLEVKHSYSTGNVISNFDNTGGFIGYVMTGSDAIFENCYTKSSITDNIDSAGFLGYLGGTASTTIRNCSVLGYISSSNGTIFLARNNGSNKGSLVIENCHYNADLNDKSLALVRNSSGEGSLDITDDTIRSQTMICDNIAPFDYSKDIDLGLQIGVDSSDNSRINFKTNIDLSYLMNLRLIGKNDKDHFKIIDEITSMLSTKQTQFGAVTNRLESALDEIQIQYNNLASSRSTLRDADMAELSSEYIKMQILQQASATLLATANQSPSIALQLI